MAHANLKMLSSPEFHLVALAPVLRRARELATDPPPSLAGVLTSGLCVCGGGVGGLHSVLNMPGVLCLQSAP